MHSLGSAHSLGLCSDSFSVLDAWRNYLKHLPLHQPQLLYMAPTTMPKKPAKSTDKTPPGVKGAFIREHHGKSVKEIIALAQQAGLEIEASYIYNIRSEDKRNGVKAPPAKTANGKKPVAVALTTDVDASVKSQLRNFVLRVGLDRAPLVFDQVLSEIKREVTSAS